MPSFYIPKMSPTHLIICLIALQITPSENRGTTTDDVCNHVKPFRGWKQTFHLWWLQKLSRQQRASFVLSTKDAEYYFGKQQKYRDCVVGELKEGQTVTYFGREYKTASDFKSNELFCKDNEECKLMRHCRQVLEDSPFRSKFMLHYIRRNEAKCLPMIVNFKTFQQRTIERSVVKCPATTRLDGEKHERQSVYISCADDPLFNESLVYVLVEDKEPPQQTNELKVIALGILYKLDEFE